MSNLWQLCAHPNLLLFLLHGTRCLVVTFPSFFSRSEHDGHAARRETEVMSLKWHLEQWEDRYSHLTHSVVSERIDSVNENLQCDPQFKLEEQRKRNGGQLEQHLQNFEVHQLRSLNFLRLEQCCFINRLTSRKM